MTTVLDPTEAFAYLARFSNAAEWDPGVTSAEQLSSGPPALGSTYRLVVRFLGLSAPMDYSINEIEVPRRVVLQAENVAIRSTDVIEVAPQPSGGSHVVYEANLRTKGVFVVISPVIALAFRGVGDRAAKGLRQALNR
jgi:Polyketide cyclase / dehydrase and lipid transport